MNIVRMMLPKAPRDSAKKISVARWSARLCPIATSDTIQPTMSVKIIRARKLNALEIRIVLDRRFVENKSVNKLNVLRPPTVAQINTVHITNANRYKILRKHYGEII